VRITFTDGVPKYTCSCGFIDVTGLGLCRHVASTASSIDSITDINAEPFLVPDLVMSHTIPFWHVTNNTSQGNVTTGMVTAAISNYEFALQPPEPQINCQHLFDHILNGIAEKKCLEGMGSTSVFQAELQKLCIRFRGSTLNRWEFVGDPIDIRSKHEKLTSARRKPICGPTSA
jgi:hypothetical protein